MVEVRLHGALGKQFGTTWNLEIATPGEAVAAIDANFPGFRKAITDLSRTGHCFRVRTKSHDYNDSDIGVSLGASSRLDIIPIVTGASAGVRFVIGAVLVATSFLMFGGPFGGPAGMVTFNAGFSLMLGSVVEWLTPTPKRDTSPASLKSWTLSGPNNDLGQDQVVPVIYGEVLTGGYPISGGLSASDVTPGGSIDPAVVIGGQFDISATAPGQSSVSIVTYFSAGPFNLREPFTYAWTFPGFIGVAVAAVNVTTTYVKVTFTASLAPGTPLVSTGTAHLVMTGKNITTSTVETVTATETVTLRFDNNELIYQYGIGG